MMPEDRPPYIEPSEEVKQLFREWRSPRIGNSNPERLNNPVWEWLIHTRINAFEANQTLGGPDGHRRPTPQWQKTR